MKKAVLIFLIFGIISCSQKKQEQTDNTSKPEVTTGEPPLIEFDGETQDFGKIKAGEILTYSFVFTNRGNSDLIIKNAEADCGCLQVKYPEDPVKSGKKGIIEVEFNSAGLIGRQLKTIEIQSNSKEPKHLIIFAEVENEQIEFKY